MKKSKILTMALVFMLSLGVLDMTAFAGTTKTADTADVYVTISNEKGKLVLAQEKIAVTDVDEDGALTINDALYAAHEAKFDGGAAVGYFSYAGDHGLALGKLWGYDNGSGYGYCVNNQSSMGLADPVKDGDYINAFIYTDTELYSDLYCYFDVNTISVKVGEEISLTLSGAGYDENWQPITLPVENAVITVNGEKTEYKTDKDGKVSFRLAKEGSYVISAVSDTQTLVPPVCKATASAVETTPSDTNTSGADNTTVSAKMGDDANIFMITALFVVSFTGILVFAVMGKKSYEK